MRLVILYISSFKVCKRFYWWFRISLVEKRARPLFDLHTLVDSEHKTSSLKKILKDVENSYKICKFSKSIVKV